MTTPTSPTSTQVGGVRLDYSISLGTLATLAVMILGGGTAWGTMRADMGATRALIAVQAERITTVELAAAASEARIRALELSDGRKDERLNAILSTLGRIEQALGQGRAP